MGEALGAELSSHGIPQQQALKRNGIYVDWTGRYASLVQRNQHQPWLLLCVCWYLIQLGTPTNMFSVLSKEFGGVTAAEAAYIGEAP